MWIHLVPLELIDGASDVPVSLSGTYHSYISSSGYLQTVVKGVEVSRQHKITGKTQLLNTLQTDANRKINKVRITSSDSPYTDLQTNDIINAYTDAAITINFLPGVDGERRMIKNTGSFNVTLVPNGVESIEENTIYPLECLQYEYDSTDGWFVI